MMDREVLYELSLEEETVPELDMEDREPLEAAADSAVRVLGNGD